MNVSFSPTSMSCFTFSTGSVSTVSSTPWPASATAGGKTPSSSKTTSSWRLILRPLFILHGHIFIVCCPFHGAFGARGVAHDPKAAAGIGRAGEDQTVLVNKHVVGMTGIRVDPAEYRRHEMADGFRLMRIGNID